MPVEVVQKDRKSVLDSNMIQKILELTTKDFLTGLAVSSHMPSSGVFIDAAGINPYRNPFTKSADVGLLQTSEATQAIGVGTIADVIYSGVLDGAALKAYLYGNGGKLYDLSTSDFSTISVLRTVPNPASGLGIWAPYAGTRTLFYAREQNIGTFDLSSTYNDSSYASLNQTTIHDMHQFVGNLYFCNKAQIGGLTDDGDSSPLLVNDLLDLPQHLTAVTLSDDGYYLIIGATANTISGNLSFHTENKIYFWDTISESWTKEYSIPTAYIASIQRIGSLNYAICADGLYAFNFSIPPTLIIPFDNDETPARVGGVHPTHQLATVKDSVLYWLSSATDICAYGSPVPGLSQRFFKPFKAIQGSVPSYLQAATKTRFLTADDTNKLRYIDVLSGGNTGLTAETIFIPLEQKWNIKRIETTFGEPLASGDELNIDVKSDEDTAATDYGTISFASHGATRTKMLAKDYTAENLKLFFNFNGGNVKIKKVAVYGERVNI